MLADENGGLGLNNGQETPTGRPLSLSRVKAEVAYSAACCTDTDARQQTHRYGHRDVSYDGLTRSSLGYSESTIGPTSGAETAPVPGNTDLQR